MDAQALLDRAGHDLGSVARASMRDVIAQRLAALIGSGALSVGDPLPSERELATAMNVSRETIRSAVLILSTLGVVSVTHGARTTVVSDDVGELAIAGVLSGATVGGYALDDIHESRLLVEGRIAHLVVGQIDEATTVRLERMIEAQVRAIDDPVRYLILDREFHTVIYRACGNRVLSDLATTLYSYLMDHRRSIVARRGSIARSIDDHRAILNAIADGDADAVATAFGVHERRIYETTRQLLEEAGNNKSDGGDES